MPSVHNGEGPMAFFPKHSKRRPRRIDPHGRAIFDALLRDGAVSVLHLHLEHSRAAIILPRQRIDRIRQIDLRLARVSPRPNADHTPLEGHAMTPQRRPGMPFVILDKRAQWREKGSLGTAWNPESEQHREITIDYRCGRRRAHCQGADMELGQIRSHFSIASPHQGASLPPPRRLRTR